MATILQGSAHDVALPVGQTLRARSRRDESEERPATNGRALTLVLVEGVVVFLGALLRLFAPWPPPGQDLRLATLPAMTWTLCVVFAFHLTDLYSLRLVKTFRQFLARLPRAAFFAVVFAGVLQLLVPTLRVSARQGAEILVVTALLLLPIRAALHHLLDTHPFSRRVLILGTTELAGKLVREMTSVPDLRDVAIGVADDGSCEFRPELPSLSLGSIDNLSSIIEGFDPDLIVCALAERHDLVLMRELLKPRVRGIPVEDGVKAYERLTGKIAIEHATPRAILFSKTSGSFWLALTMARALSLFVAACGLALVSPLLLPIALWIKLDSDGPVFFLHERVGLGGRPFKLIKFRTMTTGGAQSEWAADNGHRTTRAGRWLRRFRVDEVPQFLNILRGDMNLVGPRPHPVSNVELFNERIPYYGVRCSIRPGVTGWAQIRYGYANNLSEETEKMRYDLHYIKHISFALDLRILFETVKVVIEGGRPAALVDQAGAQPSPIYFGIEHHGNVSPAQVAAPAAAKEGVVVSMQERRAKSSLR
jgi:exopolysaccharide biosynthesis polyprenyl glycosylphosphotransferase